MGGMKRIFVTALSLLLVLSACAPAPSTSVTPASPAAPDLPSPSVQPPNPTRAPTAAPANPEEVEPVLLPLAGPGARADAEISGLAWLGDDLILLPQYPQRISPEAGGALLAITKTQILDHLDGRSVEPLQPRLVRLHTGGLERSIRGFEGFEALAFVDSAAYLTIEAGGLGGMRSYLVRGTYSAVDDSVTLAAAGIVEVPLDVQISNFSNEAIHADGERLILFYEANGARASPQALAQVYSADLQPLGALAMPPLEYRLTDAAPGPGDALWVVNFFYPGDLKILPLSDPIAARWGQGPTHAQASVVERLVALEIPEGGDSIRLADRPPIQIQLAEGQIPRNWEGLAYLEGRGFLIATDKFPETLLAFLPVTE
jgi:hypothetical protein